jgi:hypothetical protein
LSHNGVVSRQAFDSEVARIAGRAALYTLVWASFVIFCSRASRLVANGAAWWWAALS